MIGRQIDGILASNLYLNVETGRLQAWNLAINATPEKGVVAYLATDWVQVGGDDFHALEIMETDQPFGVEITVEAGSVKSTGPCSRIELDALRQIKAIDIVQYETETAWCAPPNEGKIFSDATIYDRALVFYFDGTEPLTITTEHGPILGGFEIRTGVKPGFDHDEGKFSTRVTLN